MTFLSKVLSNYEILASDPPVITQLRKIVEEKSMGNVDGQDIDLYSASAILQVYDHINDDNKKKYAAMPIQKMAEMAFKLK